MTHFQYPDRVTAQGESGTFLGYWPDRVLAKVRLASGRIRSFFVNNIQPAPKPLEMEHLGSGRFRVEAHDDVWFIGLDRYGEYYTLENRFATRCVEGFQEPEHAFQWLVDAMEDGRV